MRRGSTAAALAVALAAAMLLIDSSTHLYADYADGYRTAQAMTLSDAVKVWRRAAWQEDDFYSQIRLGDLYSGNQSLPVDEVSNDSFYDPVEAYVWYYLALRPFRNNAGNDNSDATNIIYKAAANEDSLYNTLSFDQRLEARSRIIYILASRGAEGFFALGHIHYPYAVQEAGNGKSPIQWAVPICLRAGVFRRGFWEFIHWFSPTFYPMSPEPYWQWIRNTQDEYNKYSGKMADGCNPNTQPPEPPDLAANEPANNQQQNGAVGLINVPQGGGNQPVQNNWLSSSVFLPSDLEAYVFFKRAALLDHPLADSYVEQIKQNHQGSDWMFAQADKRASTWAPPFEYYPGITPGGLINSDESPPSFEQRVALGRVNEIPFRAVADALEFRGLLKRVGCGPPPQCFRIAVLAFQKALDFDQTGVLSPPQTVRLIQMAAYDGNAESQYRLGIMYAKGIGVPQNFPRAEKWFIKAANQQQADALFDLYLLYMVGPNGIDQNKDKANSAFLRAFALGKNLRERCELKEMLALLDNAQHGQPDGAKK